MKKYIFLILTGICTIAGMNAAPLFTLKPGSPRSLKLSATPELELIRNGNPQMRVYVPGKAPYPIRAAAKEFAELLGQIAGKPVAVMNNIPVNFSGALFRIGDAAFAAEQKIDLKSIDRDGFVIKTAGKAILIAGSDVFAAGSGRGTLFGCYEFLEHFAGVRFYFPGKSGTLIPHKNTWNIPQITLYDRPDSQFRRIYWPAPGGAAPVWHEKVSDWRTPAALHEARMRQSDLVLPNCHGLSQLGLVQRFAKTHPEYFALKGDGKRSDGSNIDSPDEINGHICFSNPGIWEEIYQDAKAVLTGQSGKSRGVIYADGSRNWKLHKKPFFNLMPNDSMIRCRCKECQKHFKGLSLHGGSSKDASRFVWHRLLTIPRRLQKERVPGFVTMMAYDLCTQVPEEPIPSNVVLQVATTGPWLENRPAEQKKDDELLDRWIKATGAKIYQWNYPTKCTVKELPLIPNHTPEAIGSYYKRMFPKSFGAMLNASSDYWFFGHLNFYVFSKVMWNHETDTDALLDEYFMRMFGKGAPKMKLISKILEKHWLNDICGNVVQTSFGPVAAPPSEHQLWTKIFSPGEIAKINKLFDDAFRAAAPADRERIQHWRKAMWQPTVDGATAYFRNAAALDEWKCRMMCCTGFEIDGKGGNPAWSKIEPVVLLPVKGDRAEVLTKVKMLCDKQYFYFLFDCAEPFTESVMVEKRPFDDHSIWKNNSVEIHLDTEGKKKSDYQIIVDVAGNLADLRNTPATLGSDWKWNSGAVVKTSVIPGRKWLAEIKLPRKNLPAVSNERFYANFCRHRKNRSVPYYHWSVYAKNFSDLSNFGLVEMKPVTEKNLVSDGDFAVTGLKGAKGSRWVQSPERDTNVFRTAGASMRFQGKMCNLFHRLELKADTEYVLSFWLKLDKVKLLSGIKPSNGGFYVRIDDGVKAHYFPKQPYFDTIQWIRLEHRWRTSKSVKRPYIHFTLRNCSGRAWVDHVELKEMKKK